MDISIEQYTGSHRDLDWSFRVAEDSEELMDAYIDLGPLWVARAAGGDVIGHLQAVPRDEEVWEVTSTAVVESQARSGRWSGAAGAGRRRGARGRGAPADPGDGGRRRWHLRFYQRCGFRMTRVVQNVFTPVNGYRAGLEVDGIPLLDQVWFERVL
jgi:hypothetical protein